MTRAAGESPVADLWDFAVALYGRPGVSRACLALQDRCGLDVNLLLFAVWSAVAGPGRLDAPAFTDCLAVTDTWREQVIRPLRAARRASAAGIDGVAAEQCAALTSRLKDAELAAERVELQRLAQWAAERGAGGGAGEPQAVAASNLVAYLAAARVAPADAAPEVRAILAGAFPPVSRA
jgi:uncharacterized protein (TIGR02444 family)